MTQVPEQNAARPEATGVICEPNTVDVLGVRFPRLYSEEAIALLLQALRQRERLGVCFPDMSTLNLAWETPSFRRLLKRKFLVLPDGAGVMWAALCRGKPLPENLNGTDGCFGAATLGAIAPKNIATPVKTVARRTFRNMRVMDNRAPSRFFSGVRALPQRPPRFL